MVDKKSSADLVTPVLFLRFIALLTLPALLLGPASQGCPFVPTGHVVSQTCVESQKAYRLVLLARDEQNKPVTHPVFRPLPTPASQSTFVVFARQPTWRLTATVPAPQVPHFAPSLTGIVVLQI